MMYGFDPIYFLFVGPAMLLAMWASFRTKSAFNRYAQVPSSGNLSGAQAAQILLDRAGIGDVKVIPTQGMLSDHYNPVNKTLALSEGVYASRSVAAVGVACHEAGHAIQHARSYGPLWLRSALVPTVGIGSNLGLIVMMAGLFFQKPAVVGFGAILFSAVLAFQLITLPVEFDASSRAKKLIKEYGLVGPRETEGVDRVLNAAALTYVAAAVSTLMTLLYYLFRAGLLGGRRDE